MNPLLLALVPALHAAAPSYAEQVVTLTITWQGWQSDQPWTKTSPATRTAQAVVVEGPPGEAPLLLTTAAPLEDATLVRTRKHGEAGETLARPVYVDREAGLAVLAVPDVGFFRDLRPARLARKPVVAGEVWIARWRDNQLEAAEGRVTRAVTRTSENGLLRTVSLNVATDLRGGAAEPVFAGGELVGITTGHGGNEVRVQPADFLRPWLDEVRRTGEVRPWPGSLGASLQEIRSPALAAWLGLDVARGQLVKRVAQGGSACGVLRRGDVLLAVDGQEIDGEGNVRDPVYGLLYFEYLLSRHHAGEVIPVRVLRDGRVLDLEMPLRTFVGESWLVPVDQVGAPPYLVAGGLVFREYDSWYGGRSSELRIIAQLERTAQTGDRRRVVVLADVLPDPYNLGYHGFGELPVQEVNGLPVDAVSDVAEALAHPLDGYHVVRFRPNPRLQELVLDAATLEAATARIAAAYGVAETYRPGRPPPPLGPPCDGAESLAAGE